MPVPQPYPKNSQYTQLGLVSADGTRIGAGAAPAVPGQAVPLIVDVNGAPYVNATITGPLPPFSGDVNVATIADIVPLISLLGRLAVNIASGDVPVLLDASGRPIVDVGRIGGIAPLVSLLGRLGVNIASGDVDVLLDAAGRVAEDLQRIGGIAPLVSVLGRLGVNIASGDFAVLLDAAGRIRNVAENANAIPVGTPVHLWSNPLNALVTNWGVAGAPRMMRARGVTGTVGVFLMAFDAAALPANGTIPLTVQSTPGTQWDLDFTTQGGIVCANGIWIAASTTPTALTIAPAICLAGTLSYV